MKKKSAEVREVKVSFAKQLKEALGVIEALGIHQDHNNVGANDEVSISVNGKEPGSKMQVEPDGEKSPVQAKTAEQSEKHRMLEERLRVTEDWLNLCQSIIQTCKPCSEKLLQTQ